MHYVGAIITNHPEILSPRLNGESQDDEFKVHADDKNKPGGGFTLIELLVVVVIIGTLAALVTIVVGSARAKARDGKRVGDIKEIQNSLELYYADENAYPTYVTPGNSLVGPTSGRTYLTVVPRNPSPKNDNTCANQDYSYSQTQSGASYQLAGCVGGDTGQLTAGLIGATPKGVDNNLADGLIGWWRMNGDATDASGYGNNGTVTGATLTTNRSGTANSAYNFNGSSNYISSPLSFSPGTGDFAVSLWYYIPTGGSIYQTLIEFGTSTFVIGIIDSARLIKVHYNTGAAAYKANVPLDAWTHLVVVRASGVFYIYINASSTSTGNDDPTHNFVGGTTKIGVRNSDWYLAGSVDDVRVYNRALSAAEVAQLYASGQ